MNFPWYSTNVGSGSLLFRYESGHLNQAFTWNLNPSNLFHFPVLDIYWNMSSHLLENKVHSWQKPTNIWLFIIKGFKKNSLIWVVNIFPYWFYWINCGCVHIADLCECLFIWPGWKGSRKEKELNTRLIPSSWR